MIRKKDINEINSKIDALSGPVMRKAVAYEREHDFLKEININIAKCSVVFDEKSIRYAVKIEYDFAPTMLYIEDDGEAALNERFRAMNELRLIPTNQLDQVQLAIERAKKLNAGGIE